MEFIKHSLWFPVIQSVHILGIALLIGTIFLVNLRLLGLAITRRAVDSLASDLAPWTSAGLVTVLVTGPLLFGADLHRYVINPAFVAKMLLLALALATHFILPRNRLVAVLSLILWIGVVVAGRAIADFDVA
jgi:hypothetical protein